MPDQERKETTTTVLWRELLRAQSVKTFWQAQSQHLAQETLAEFLRAECAQRSLIREHVIRRAGIDIPFGHQIFRGVRHPSRDKLLQLAFGFPLKLDEVQHMLMLANKRQLHPRIRRDDAVIYGLAHELTLWNTQDLLFELKLPLLGDELE